MTSNGVYPDGGGGGGGGADSTGSIKELNNNLQDTQITSDSHVVHLRHGPHHTGNGTIMHHTHTTQLSDEMARDILVPNSHKNLSRRSSVWSNSESSRSIFVKDLKKKGYVGNNDQPTESEKKVLASYSSLNYSPTHSVSYINWLREHPPPRWEFDRWTLVFLIGLTIGIVGWLQKQSLELLDKFKWDRGKEFTKEDSLWDAWGWVAGLASIYIIVGSFLVVFIHPPAAGSGVPEVISFLNGVIVHGSLSLKQLIVKFFANVLAVSSGIPCAIQGPMIAMGAVIGAGMGQFRSKSLGISPNIFSRFRNAEDRRTFTTAGVAAGVASAFNAPIGGLLFAMEDLSSAWNRRISWQTFFCAGIAAITAHLMNSAFTAFSYEGSFGLLSMAMTEPIPMHILILLPAIVIGIVGGLLGAFFTQLNAFIVKTRKRLVGKIRNQKAAGLVRMLEVLIIALIMVTVTVFLPDAFECTYQDLNANDTRPIQRCYVIVRGSTTLSLEQYNCPEQAPMMDIDNHTFIYSEVATLMQGSGTRFLDQLWARGVHRWFGYLTLFYVFLIWFITVCWACGSALAGGIFIPNLITGALYGRMIGLACVDIYEAVTGESVPTDQTWAWIDPGVLAVIGSGSMLGGVTRLCLAITVITVEMNGDIELTVPILVSIWVAKMIADRLALPLYKYQLRGKMMPNLDPEPPVVRVGGQLVSLELFKAKDIMSRNVCTLDVVESVAHLAKLIMETDHGNFPVVKRDEATNKKVAYGTLTRTELYVILCCEDVFSENERSTLISPKIPYEEVSVDYISDEGQARERVRSYTRFPIYNQIFVNLEEYINISAPKIDEDYSLHRTYLLFRTLGLRQLMIVDVCNCVTGVITRKDLLPFNVESKILGLADEREGVGDDATLENGRGDYSLPGKDPEADGIKVIVEEEEEDVEEDDERSLDGYHPDRRRGSARPVGSISTPVPVADSKESATGTGADRMGGESLRSGESPSGQPQGQNELPDGGGNSRDDLEGQIMPLSTASSHIPGVGAVNPGMTIDEEDTTSL